MDLQGLSTLSGRESLLIILHNVPDGKTDGICQQTLLDTGVVASLRSDCIEGCVMFGCFMFGIGYTEANGTIHKVFTPHPPEY